MNRKFKIYLKYKLHYKCLYCQLNAFLLNAIAHFLVNPKDKVRPDLSCMGVQVCLALSAISFHQL